MLYWHRLFAVLGALLLTYIAVTGAGIELSDMRALVTHAPETDPDMLMMRQHIDGPPNYGVVSAPDYTSAALPAGLDIAQGLAQAAALGRAAVPGADLRLVELRLSDGRPAAHVQMGGKQMMFDLASGQRLAAAHLPPPPPTNLPAPRAQFKFFHKFTFFGRWATAFNALAGIGLCGLLFTGIAHYAKLYTARLKLERPSPFWRSGTWWRNFHRWTAVVCGVLVLWIAVSGLALSIDNFGAFISIATSARPQGIDPFTGDLSSPLKESELAGMTRTTLAAFAKAEPNTGIKVIRLRYFVGYPQGVVVAADAATSQLVFNARSGQRMSMHEAGYPNLNFPSGWDWHQRLKRLHRGDFFGMPGRWFDTIGALALVYLCLSGIIMYVQLWLARRRTGRKALVW